MTPAIFYEEPDEDAAYEDWRARQVNPLDLEQGSPEWLAARAGLVTASRMSDVIAKIKTGEAAARRDYRMQIVAEIITGRPLEDSYVNADMQRGLELEPFARAAYEVRCDVLVRQVGLVPHPTIPRAAASPDGLVGDDGVLEIKCPRTATHIQYMLDGSTPAKCRPQMLWQLACTGRQWVDFVSYDPTIPDLQLFVARLERDDKRIAELEDEARAFLKEVDAMVSTVRRLAA